MQVMSRSTDGIPTFLTEVEECRSFLSPQGKYRYNTRTSVPATAPRREDIWESGSITPLLSNSALVGDEWSDL